MTKKNGTSATGLGLALAGRSAALAKLIGARAARDSAAAASALIRLDIVDTPRLTIELITALGRTVAPFANAEKPQLFPWHAARFINNRALRQSFTSRLCLPPQCTAHPERPLAQVSSLCFDCIFLCAGAPWAAAF